MFNKNNLQEAYANLPQDLKDALYSIDFAKTIQAIGSKQGLLIDQTGKLAEEIGFVMLGITHPDTFVDTIAEKLAISKDKANIIAEEVNEKIFLSIRASLQKIHSETDGGEDTSHFEETPSRESVLAGIEDPKSLAGQPINALSPKPTQNPSPSPIRTTIANSTPSFPAKITPPPTNLPTAPVSILEKKLQ
ncbi:MAG: hypothetical protein RLZZ347_652, partial [Candidatus Parcubacteria bacterium]